MPHIVGGRVDWWLAEVGEYGYAHTLIDGPHSDWRGVKEAFEIIRSLKMERGRKFCCVRVEQTELTAANRNLSSTTLKGTT